MASRSTPPRILPTPDPVDPELEPLLSEPFASAWAAPGSSCGPGADPARSRLLGRVAASRAASAAMVTSRARRLVAEPLAPGVSRRCLYAAPGGRPGRPGEPLRASLIELQPGATWRGPDPHHHREWLVLRGRVNLGDDSLAACDYHRAPAGAAAPALSSDDGAVVFLRESVLPDAPEQPAITVRDAEAGWPEFAPGIRRRVLWQHGGQAALLYQAEPGAAVPTHTHGHDEECLMVRGELFLDDTLLQTGDYQLAPAGTGHRVTETDTGVLLYAHGDLDMRFTG